MERRFRLSYRTAEEVGRWRSRDPLVLGAALLDAREREAIDAEVAQELARAYAFAAASPAPDPADAEAYLYADTSAFTASAAVPASAAGTAAVAAGAGVARAAGVAR